MPRFQDEHVAALKRAMLKRVPECLFTPEDVEQITEETGLNHAQIQCWGENLRYRLKAEDREGFLRSDGSSEKADGTKTLRFYVSCFNIDMDFIKNLEIKKANDAGVFAINFIHAALNKEACSGELFLELKETIRVCTLVAQLEENGACQVNVVTFKNNDGYNSASNALLRVWLIAEKSGIEEYVMGTVNKDLMDTTKIKMENEKKKTQENGKNEAKFQAGLKQSMEDMGGKVDNMNGKIDNVQQGVCVIIPDYQKMLKDNMDKLAHKTKEVDRIEHKMGQKTHEINVLSERIDDLEQKLKQETRKHEREMAEMQEKLEARDKSLKTAEEMIEVYKVLENVKYIMELDRVSKRSRGD